MQPSVEDVVRSAAQPLMSDEVVQEHFLRGLKPLLGAEEKRPLDLSKALVSYPDLLTMALPERFHYLPWFPEAGHMLLL